MEVILYPKHTSRQQTILEMSRPVDDAQDEQSSAETVTSPIQHQLDIVQRGSKRKRSSKDSRGAKRARNELADAAAAEVGPEPPSSDAVVPAGGGDDGDGWVDAISSLQAYNGSPVQRDGRWSPSTWVLIRSIFFCPRPS
ncbi:hypothetical protein ONS95_004490 [Cadophora gregata]|uniref:uncharacterized protein n=1 Tax=Cadophora gregata TaxID=51156 RepID=UPI0026DB2280|nr:uncharacterized protein ONS95_004490 [Cadophora gregata]KAK0105982.1 hypothetical protein ONS95_004490 [Cadophora gregata]